MECQTSWHEIRRQAGRQVAWATTHAPRLNLRTARQRHRRKTPQKEDYTQITSYPSTA